MIRPVAALLLVLALLSGGAEHAHAGSTDGDCPACQLERTTPAAPAATVVAAAPSAPGFVEPPAPAAAPAPRLAPLTVAPKTSPPRV